MRPLRHALPGGLHEISIRVTGEHLLLKPGKALNNMVLGIIGRAQLQEDVKVHAFVVLSNHYHSQHPLTHELAKVQTNQHTAMVSGMFQTYCLGLSKIAWARMKSGGRQCPVDRPRMIMASPSSVRLPATARNDSASRRCRGPHAAWPAERRRLTTNASPAASGARR